MTSPSRPSRWPPRLRVETPDDGRQLLADTLWALGATAVLEDEAALEAGFGNRASTEAAAAALAGRFTVRLVDDDDRWEDAWREHVGAVRVGRLLVLPPWASADVARGAGPGTLSLKIDPGRSFGSGHHPSTQLCLLELQALLRPGCSVLDVGSGTGLLAIAAASLGARPVVALDRDPEATALTRRNAASNRVAVLGLAGPTTGLRRPPGGFDLVVANLGGALAPLSLAGELHRLLAASGRCVVGGLLEKQIDQLAGGPGGLVAERRALREGWAAVVLQPGR